MADITRKANISLESLLLAPNFRLSGLKAGEALARGDACYLKSDGLVWKSNGTAATAPAKFRGLADDITPVGEAVTLINGCEVEYASGMTPGAELYVSATAGALSDAPTTGGVTPVAFVRDATTIYVYALGGVL